MVVSRFAVTSDPLDPGVLISAVMDAVRCHDATAGAVTSFIGTVRGDNLGRRVLRLEYEGYEPLAIKVFGRIADEARARWPEAEMALHHRLGRLDVGEASVAIAGASPHRAEAFAVCRYAIERVKQIAPIWKHEFFEGGDVWIEGATADPDDEAAREDAYRLACVVTVRLFARLRDIAGAGALECELPDGATAETLWTQLASEHPGIGAYRESVSTAVNEEYARMSRQLADGDEVAFLPPVSGG